MKKIIIILTVIGIICLTFCGCHSNNTKKDIKETQKVVNELVKSNPPLLTLITVLNDII